MSSNRKYKPVGVIPSITAKEIRKGYTYFCVRYDGWGGKYRVVVKEKNKADTRKFFNKYFPLATIISIQEGQF